MNGVTVLMPLLAGLSLIGCHRPPAERPADPQIATIDSTTAERTAPLFADLGDHHHPISTRVPQAQRYFDQGLILTFGFNHAEGIRSFREAARLDPNCAICYWGIALAYGPNINKPMDDANVPDAWAALKKAQALASKATAVEQAYITALAPRYAAAPVADRSELDRDYAHAMRELVRMYPNDADAAALFAESLMDLMPWDYWKNPNEPKDEAAEAIAELESVLARHPYHPGANHFYIHAVEASSTPGRAEAAADRLNGLVPGAGHLVHMPAHIYMRVGRYHDASVVNELAAQADESYIAQCRVQGFYPAAYYPHNIHFLWASATMEGRSEVAIAAARKLAEAVPPKYLDDFPLLEEFMPTPMFAYARFGRWDEILATDAPPPERQFWTGMWHYARGVALLATANPEAAKEELITLRDIAARKDMQELTLFSGSTAGTLLTIASHVLAGDLAGSDVDHDTAIAEYRAAVDIQDALAYTEPPPWYFPVRQALGAQLLDAGQAEAAAAVYREDLIQNPDNGWALYGLAQALRAAQREDEAVAAEAQFRTAWRRADVRMRAPMRVSALSDELPDVEPYRRPGR